MRHLALLFLALPQTLMAAEAPLTGAEFDAYTQGKTLTYSSGSGVYGTEQYLPGNRVLWAFEGDICRHGQWYQDQDRICFTYEHDPTPQCWTFWQSEAGLVARFATDGPGSELTEVENATQPLACAGPEVGV